MIHALPGGYLPSLGERCKSCLCGRTGRGNPVGQCTDSTRQAPFAQTTPTPAMHARWTRSAFLGNKAARASNVFFVDLRRRGTWGDTVNHGCFPEDPVFARTVENVCFTLEGQRKCPKRSSLSFSPIDLRAASKTPRTASRVHNFMPRCIKEEKTPLLMLHCR